MRSRLWALVAVACLATTSAPKAQDDVERLVNELASPDQKVRIAAAQALLKTPPELVNHIKYKTLPYEEDRNAGAWHFINVVESLARQSWNPDTALGKYCIRQKLPKRCQLVSELRWLSYDQFGADPFAEGGKGPLSSASLTTMAQKAYLGTLDVKATTEAHMKRLNPRSVSSKGGLRWYMLPVCGGRGGMYEACAYHFLTAGPGGEHHKAFYPFIDTPGIPYQNFNMFDKVRLRINQDRWGLFITDGGCCGDEGRRVWIYDLKDEIKPVCVAQYPSWSDLPKSFFDELDDVTGCKSLPYKPKIEREF